MQALTSELWIDTAPVSILGMRLTATMTAIRLPDGSLLLYSPLELTPERRAAVLELGPIRHLYAPNLYHHMWLGPWAEAFPDARVHAPPGLASKRTDLRIDREVGSASEPEPAFAGVLFEQPILGFALAEIALIHLSSQTLLCADLVHNIGRPSQPWARLYTKLMGFHDRVAISRMIRWGAFRDRSAARRSIDALLEQPFERMVVGHGAPVESGAKQALASAYAWLS